MVHREGDVAVLEGGSTLPPLCIQCAEPATILRTTKVSYTHPLAALLFFAGPLGLLAGTMTQTYQIGYGVCQKHRWTGLRRFLQAGLTMGGGGYVFFSILSSGEYVQSTIQMGLLWAGLVAMLAGGAAMPIVARPLSAGVRDKRVHVRRLPPELLDLLPTAPE